MKTAFLKFLPIAAAVMLATSCSKDDNDNAPATQSGKDGVHTVSTTGIPFTIRVNTGRSLKKVGYAESTNEGEKGWYNITFSDNDVAKLKMIIKEGNTQIGEATLQSDKATFSGSLTQQPSSNASLTAEISVSGSKNSSNESLAALLATCAHTFSGTFTYGAAEVDLTDQNAYLDITYRESDKIDLNSSEITVTDSRVWVAVPANAEVTSQALGISKPAKEVDPGTIYTVVRNFTPKAFSVSATKKVYFSSGNLQYNPKQNQWQFAAHQYDICITEDHYDVSSLYYNSNSENWIDLFGWGTWLDGENVLKPYETQEDDLSYIWSGNSAIGENWTTLSKDEWIYLLGDYEDDEIPCRTDAKTLRATKEVNGVFGLVILPDGATADIANDSWETLESAGAVFLPAAGYIYGRSVSYVGRYGYYWSSSAYNEDCAYHLLFYSGKVIPGYPDPRHFGCSVRLVRAL